MPWQDLWSPCPCWAAPEVSAPSSARYRQLWALKGKKIQHPPHVLLGRQGIPCVAAGPKLITAISPFKSKSHFEFVTQKSPFSSWSSSLWWMCAATEDPGFAGAAAGDFSDRNASGTTFPHLQGVLGLTTGSSRIRNVYCSGCDFQGTQEISGQLESLNVPVENPESLPQAKRS